MASFAESYVQGFLASIGMRPPRPSSSLFSFPANQKSPHQAPYSYERVYEAGDISEQEKLKMMFLKETYQELREQAEKETQVRGRRDEI